MAIYIDAPQGSANWARARLGKPTASEFHRILTATGKLSSQADKYAYRLIAEMLLQSPMQDLEGLQWVEHGKELEDKAAKTFAFENDVEVTEVGFITTDDGEIGASPDRLVNKREILEIKCPSPQVLVQYSLEKIALDTCGNIDKPDGVSWGKFFEAMKDDAPPAYIQRLIENQREVYRPQRQGQLWVGEFEKAHFIAYHTEFPPVEYETKRDQDYIDKLEKSVREFVAMKNDMLSRIKAFGYFAERDYIAGIGERELETSIAREFGAELLAG